MKHYVIVRTDLPKGVGAAMVAHAAAESAYAFAQHRNMTYQRCTVVVLGVPDEEALFTAYKMLKTEGFKIHDFIESEGYYANELMAVGVEPASFGDLEKLGKCLRDFKLYGDDYNTENHIDPGEPEW